MTGTDVDASFAGYDPGEPDAVLADPGLVPVGPARQQSQFIATRPEQYMPAMLFFALAPALGLVDMIIALKLLIVTVWVGAGVSKIGKHFGKVVPPMISNTPWMLSKGLKRAHYRNFPNDLQPRPGPLHGPRSGHHRRDHHPRWSCSSWPTRRWR